MRLSVSNLKEIINNIKPSLLNKRINGISLVNSRLFLFTINNSENKLIVDLDNTSPFIGIIKTDYEPITLKSVDIINKILLKGHPQINNIDIVNEDKIIIITTKATDAFYHQNEFYLYIELINSHANMILTDQKNKIISAFYETNFDNPRPIVKGFTYVIPTNKNIISNDDFDYKVYMEQINKQFKDGIQKRKKEKFNALIKAEEKKLKSLHKKIDILAKSLEDAKDNLKFIEIGNEILTNIDSIKKGMKEFNNIKLDEHLTASQNAEKYFNKYKKAKRTIDITKVQIEKSKKELEEVSYNLEFFKLADEQTLSNYFNIDNKKKNHKQDEKAYLPYYIKYNETNYYYGHNNIENDYLTFKMFKNSSNVVWMHLKDCPSAHLIINKNNPSNKELEIGASILLLKSNVSSGTIMYTNRKDITRGDGLAKVNINAYKEIIIRKLNSSYRELLNREKRVHE